MFSRQNICFHCLFLLIFLINLQNITCLRKQLCDDDDECLMNAVINRVYPRFVAGMPGVEPSDPLRIDAIIVDLSSIRYALYNASMTGLKDCDFVKLNNRRLSVYTLFDYAINCPTLTIESDYDLNGLIDSIPVEGKGKCKIVYGNYYISISGKHEKVKGDKGRLHVNIIQYEVTPVLQGKVKTADYQNLVFSNHDSCDNRMKIVEQMTREIVMDVFMNKYIQNLKNFHQHVPVDELHFKYVR